MKKLVSLFIATRLYIVTLPFAVGFTGAALNQFVYIANDGKFPVMLNDKLASPWSVDKNGMIDFLHCRMTKDTHLNWLADFINLKQHGILSPGDLLIYAGMWAGAYSVAIWGALMVNDKIHAR